MNVLTFNPQAGTPEERVLAGQAILEKLARPLRETPAIHPLVAANPLMQMSAFVQVPKAVSAARDVTTNMISPKTRAQELEELTRYFDERTMQQKELNSEMYKALYGSREVY
jgi:hypothetical protein